MTTAEYPQREESTEAIISSILLNLVTSGLFHNFIKITIYAYICTHTSLYKYTFLVTFQELFYALFYKAFL